MLPELTDEFVSDVTEFDTADELRSRLEQNMLALKVHNARAALESSLIEELVADLDFDLPGDLVDAGVDQDGFDRLRSPIGLDLGARTPEETAISIVAEIIAERTGRTVAALSSTTGPIHD